MKNPIRTTITLPENIFQEARLIAVTQKTSFSGLIRKLLEKQSTIKTDGVSHIELGKYKLGLKNKLSRKEIYADYLKR